MAGYKRQREVGYEIDVNALYRIVTQANDEEIEELAKSVYNELDKNTPVVTGRLKKGLKIFKPNATRWWWRVGVYGPHAHLVEEGHVMVDWRTGKVLGTVRPNNFFQRSIEAATLDADEKIMNRVTKEANEFLRS